jgi:glycosyltransferase involved in cell wall biosynthesis
MNVALFTQYYAPESGAPQRRLGDLAKRLLELGHGVTVVTGMPNYPEGVVHEGYRRRLTLREDIDGVPVFRTWLYTNPSRRFSHRVANYVSFAATGLARGLAVGPTDVVLVESPPIFSGPAAWALSRAHRAAFVLNVSDLFTESAVQLGALQNPSLVALSRGIEQFCYERAALVLGQTEGIVDDIARRAPSTRVELFPNGVDTELFKPDRRDPRLRRRYGWEDKWVVGYAGLHGPAQGLRVVLDAARALTDLPHVRFVLIGAGPVKADLEAALRREPLDNVELLPRQPPEAMPALTACFDAGLVPLANQPIFRGARPSKMFELMGAGVPLLLAARGEAERIVKEHDCGLVSDPEHGEGLAANVRRLAADAALHARLGQNARRAAERAFSRNAIARQVATMLNHAAKEQRR